MFSKESIKRIDRFVNNELEKGTFPGAVLGVVNKNEILFKKAFGFAALEPEKEIMRTGTIFDLASLTKVVATTTCIMQLIEQGKLNIWDYLSQFYADLPADKREITIFHLLTHTSGLQAIVELWDMKLNYQEKIRKVLYYPVVAGVGEKVIYSDPNFILLGDIVFKVSGKKLDEYARANIFEPLGMKRTDFNPLKNWPDVDKSMFAATERCKWRKRILRGEVHDENTFSFSGVSGHAGLFSCIDDLCVFVQMLLNKGSFRTKRILTSRSVELMTRDWTAHLNQHRGLGWDLRNNFRSSGGLILGDKSFGHTGFTGTSIWIDPDLNTGIILLTNRVHPTRENIRIINFRPRLHNLIATELLQNI